MITKYLKMFFQFLLPILRSAAIDIASDELTRMSRKDRMRRPVPKPYTSYNRQFFGVENLDDRRRAMADALDARQAREKNFNANPQNKDFHDVLMVAFDITGPSEIFVHEWLAQHMPDAGVCDGVSVDDYWIADDGSSDDRDSAVFVSKGNQRQARELLRQAGLVE